MSIPVRNIRISILALLVGSWIVTGCMEQGEDRGEPDVPAHLSHLENLTVYEHDPEPLYEIEFIREEAVYGDSEEVTFGRMGDMVVDSLGRVFIADTRTLVIHAFEPDGRWIGQLGRDGRGPGEFSSIKNLQIRRDRLFAFDSWQNNRISVFSLDTLAGEETIAIARNRGSYQELNGFYPFVAELYVRNDGTYLATFLSSGNPNISSWVHIEVQGMLWLLDQTGDLSRKLMDFTHSVRTIIPSNGVPALEVPLIPFYETALTVLSSEDRIYFAEPDHFLINVYSPDGAYERAFYYPHQKVPLTRESAIEDGVPAIGSNTPDLFINNIDSIHLPETWPVLHSLLIDDENRLWVSTIVEDFDIYEWWVLEDTGELITKFEWPRNEPIEVVRNGYMYTRETDEETGLQQVVRYRIELKEL